MAEARAGDITIAESVGASGKRGATSRVADPPPGRGDGGAEAQPATLRLPAATKRAAAKTPPPPPPGKRAATDHPAALLWAAEPPRPTPSSVARTIMGQMPSAPV